jgi:hypothetical protein
MRYDTDNTMDQDKVIYYNTLTNLSPLNNNVLINK